MPALCCWLSAEVRVQPAALHSSCVRFSVPAAPILALPASLNGSHHALTWISTSGRGSGWLSVAAQSGGQDSLLAVWLAGRAGVANAPEFACLADVTAVTEHVLQPACRSNDRACSGWPVRVFGIAGMRRDRGPRSTHGFSHGVSQNGIGVDVVPPYSLVSSGGAPHRHKTRCRQTRDKIAANPRQLRIHVRARCRFSKMRYQMFGDFLERGWE